MARNGLTDYDQRKLIMMLGLSQYGDTNIQAKLGYGVGGSSSKDLWAAAAALQTGATKSLGDNWGKVGISVVNGDNTGVDCSRVNVMGIEDPYGWQWEMLQGVFCGSSITVLKVGQKFSFTKETVYRLLLNWLRIQMVNTDKLPGRQLPAKCRK